MRLTRQDVSALGLGGDILRDVSQLHPELQHKIEQLKHICAEKGLELGIGECLRTVEEQDSLYAQGRSKPGPIVTYAPGSSYSSQHQWGIAVDFFKNVPGQAFSDINFFKKVAAYAKQLGLAWGGDWISPVDMPHLYLPYWGDTPAVLKRQYTVPERFFATWKRSEVKEKLDIDGWCGPATVTRLQEIFGTPVDGVISDQWEWYRDQNPGLVAVEWVPYLDNSSAARGSALVRKLQEMCGATVDGVIGPNTITALQRYFGTPADGYVSGPSALIMAIQRWCNAR